MRLDTTMEDQGLRLQKEEEIGKKGMARMNTQSTMPLALGASIEHINNRNLSRNRPGGALGLMQTECNRSTLHPKAIVDQSIHPTVVPSQLNRIQYLAMASQRAGDRNRTLTTITYQHQYI